MAQVQDVKINWNALVKKTTTGISNPREYQMLWRHLAYRDALLERFEDGAKPLHDDSDLEYELEAFPTVSTEASTEAVACVKVLIASGLPSDSSLMNGLTVEAPLTINIPNGQSSRGPSENSQLASSMKGTNITVPVSVQKQPLPTVTSAEGLDVNGSASGSLPARRKRKPWSTEEDEELIAAVQKCGEGNWANILKGDFKGDRTASQLSQRWAIIRKRKGNVNAAGGSQPSEAIFATRHAMSLALNMPPMEDKLKASSLTAGTTLPVHPAAAETSSAGMLARNLSQQDSAQTAVQRLGASGSSSRSRVVPKKPSTKPSAPISDSGVHLAAVAAGARIASPSDAASLLKAAQGKKAIHIMPGGGSLISSANPLPSPHLGSHPKVHYIRTGVTPTPLSTYSTVPPNASRPHLGLGKTAKAVGPSVQANPCSTGAELNASSGVTSDAASIPPNILEVKTSEDTISSSPKELQEDKAGCAGNARREEIQEKQVGLLGNAKPELVQEDQASPKCQVGIALNSKCSSSVETGVGKDRVVGIEQSNGEHEIVLPVKDEDVTIL